MSGDPRDLDTFNDFDEPDYIPWVNDRVKVDPSCRPEYDLGNCLGTIHSVEQNDDGSLGFLVELDEPTGVNVTHLFGLSLDDIDEVYA